jgi:hypothetical protein
MVETVTGPDEQCSGGARTALYYFQPRKLEHNTQQQDPPIDGDERPAAIHDDHSGSQ